jgi:hypothetical protein
MKKSSILMSFCIPITFGLLVVSSFIPIAIGQGAPPQGIANPFFSGNIASPTQGNASTALNTTNLNTSKLTPFEGESIKIFAFNSFVKASEWEPIDNYTSQGYDIKSLMPFGNRFFIVLEKDTG